MRVCVWAAGYEKGCAEGGGGDAEGGAEGGGGEGGGVLAYGELCDLRGGGGGVYRDGVYLQLGSGGALESGCKAFRGRGVS